MWIGEEERSDWCYENRRESNSKSHLNQSWWNVRFYYVKCSIEPCILTLIYLFFVSKEFMAILSNFKF